MSKPDDGPKRPILPNHPTLTDRGRQQEAERREREAEALRQNLQRRKQQQRARQQVPAGKPAGKE